MAAQSQFLARIMDIIAVLYMLIGLKAEMETVVRHYLTWCLGYVLDIRNKESSRSSSEPHEHNCGITANEI